MANYRTPENHVNQPQVAVVMVPLPVQGHLNQLLHLSRRVSAYNIPVYYVGTTTHIRQAKARVHGCDASAITNLHFHDFPTPSFQNLSPDPNSSGKYPSHLRPTIAAILSNFHEPLFMLVNQLSSGNDKRVVVIFDSLMTSAVQAIQSLPNVESYCFESISVFSLYSFYWEDAGEPDIPTEAGILKELPSTEGCFSLKFQEFRKSQRKARNFHSGTIYNASRITEGLYLDLLAKTGMLGPDKHWAVGPLNPVFGHEKQDSKSRSKCLEWLDKQPPNSVIFVSFGTTSSLSDEQIRELAFGLERSEQKFIWALRDADRDRGDIFKGEVRIAELPKGFEERVQERGIVVRDWAPQLEILKHCATGGFLSHCGWNSCMESISMGVPLATWPMHSDQPRNSVLITKVLKIGLEVRDWAHRDELVCSVTVEEAVKRLMASAEGDEMRQRAEQLADSIKQSMMEGGATRLEMDSFIAHISR